VRKHDGWLQRLLQKRWFRPSTYRPALATMLAKLNPTDWSIKKEVLAGRQNPEKSNTIKQLQPPPFKPNPECSIYTLRSLCVLSLSQGSSCGGGNLLRRFVVTRASLRRPSDGIEKKNSARCKRRAVLGRAALTFVLSYGRGG